MVPDENGDTLGGLSDDSIIGEHVIDDTDLEGILRSKYKDIMEHTAEKRGDPVVPELAGLIFISGWKKIHKRRTRQCKKGKRILQRPQCQS